MGRFVFDTTATEDEALAFSVARRNATLGEQETVAQFVERTLRHTVNWLVQARQVSARQETSEQLSRLSPEDREAVEAILIKYREAPR